ncbi:hypothetical protein COU57_04355 [Candidatus Pacearchaeota archaeon CG10_big_fil_rev_8_21_14_0_10_32_14]|nr:MAG: hypothetical protein COU57_04355 [Candidatus Pacearchaeota archaeon CG10_big_fil_rev_8_21_14_0_10_32_14]
MAKEIIINISEEKEKEFVKFLKDNNAVLIYPWSNEEKINIVNDLSKKDSGKAFFEIWNKSFSLNPEFIKIKKDYAKEGKKFVFHPVGKPTISWWRSIEGKNGRIYWQKHFLTKKLEYDIKEFDKWYDIIVNWFKKNCNKVNGVYVD